MSRRSHKQENAQETIEPAAPKRLSKYAAKKLAQVQATAAEYSLSENSALNSDTNLSAAASSTEAKAARVEPEYRPLKPYYSKEDYRPSEDQDDYRPLKPYYRTQDSGHSDPEYTSNTVAALHGTGMSLDDASNARIARAVSEAGAGIEKGSSFEQEAKDNVEYVTIWSASANRKIQVKRPAMVPVPGTSILVPENRLNEDGTLKKRKTYVKVKRKDGSNVKLTRKRPHYEKELFVAPEELAKLPERVAKKRLKRVEHEAQVKEARKAALAKLKAEGKTYNPHPDAIIQNRFEPGTVVTLGVKTQDRTPDYNDPLEIEAAKQPHNVRNNLLMAPIKRVNQPVKGNDVIAKWLDNWERTNDVGGIFSKLLSEVKRVRREENGIAYIGLPAFLLFIEGIAKRDIIDRYALDFKRFIKRREITDFIAAMKGPALAWFENRHRMESAYAMVYLDTYPVHFKLGRKRVYVEHELFIIGVTLDGRQDLLTVIPDFGKKKLAPTFWENLLGQFQEFGCQHICFMLASFKCRYLERAVRKVYPETTLQFNILEVLQVDSYQLPSEMRKEFMADSAALVDAVDYESALNYLEQMRVKWERVLPEGTTVLQGNLEYLKNYTMLSPLERKLFNTTKLVSQAAALLMGKKAPDDFFSDHAEFLNFLFYRYIIWAKPQWLESQDVALYNLKFSRIFAHLRTQEASGAKLLDELLSERQQDFMFRHFGGHFSSGPIFSLNANRKRISLTGQINVSNQGALQGATWQEQTKVAPTKVPEVVVLEPPEAETAMPLESAEAVAQVSTQDVSFDFTSEAGSSFGFGPSLTPVEDSGAENHVMGGQTAQVLASDNLSRKLKPSPAPQAIAPVPFAATLTLQEGAQHALVPRAKSLPKLKPTKLSAALSAQSSAAPQVSFVKAGLSTLELAPTMRIVNGEVLPERLTSKIEPRSEPVLSELCPDLNSKPHYRSVDGLQPSVSTRAALDPELATLGSIVPAKDTPPESCLKQVSSNIQSANAVVGMFKPTIEQALKEEHEQLKQEERQLIYRLLGHDFNFDELNNVIFMVTPIFREALQARTKAIEDAKCVKEQAQKLREKQKARERYLKRQARKAQLAADAAAFDPIDPATITVSNEIAPVTTPEPIISAKVKLNEPSGSSFDPIKVTADATYLSPITPLISEGRAVEVSPQIMSELLSEATLGSTTQDDTPSITLTTKGFAATPNLMELAATERLRRERAAAMMTLSGSALINEAERLTLSPVTPNDEEMPIMKSVDAHCPAPPSELRAALVEKLAPISGVRTTKLAKVKLK